MTHTAFMQRAIDIARAGMAEGAAPFGAVVVRDGAIVGEGCNQVLRDHDPTSHGEIEAIRDAGRRLGTWDLSGCTLYTSCEPCEMCVAAMVWARIDRLYYAATLEECAAIGLDLSELRQAVRADLHDRPLPAERVLGSPGRAMLEEWQTTPSFAAFAKS